MADEPRRSLLRRLFARDAGGTEKPPSGSKPRGRAGTVNTRGFLGDEAEFNASLRWPYNLQIYEEMVRSDATVRWLLALIETPIRSLIWDVEPAGTEDEDLEVAAFVRHALFEELDGGFDEFLRQALCYARFGHAVFERVAELREVSFDYEVESIEVVTPEPPPMIPPPREEEEGAGPPRPPAQAPPPPGPVSRREVRTQTVEREAFVISRLEPRLPRTIQRWIPVESDTSRLAGIEQWLGDGLEPSAVEIPADRLVVFTHEKEGNDWRGVSLLRPAYKPYRYKAQLESIEAIAYERSAGLPIVYPPEDATEPQITSVQNAVEALRQGENLWIQMPGPKAGTVESGGWLLEDFVLRADGDAGGKINEAIGRYDAELARIVLAEFMRLGHENVGARATGEVQQNPYYEAIEAMVGYVEHVITEAVVRPLVAWNYETERFPRLRASKAAAKSITETIDALSKASSMGLKLDPALEAWIRELLDAPERPPELDEAEAEIAARPPAEPSPTKEAEPEQAEGAAPGETMTDEAAAEAFAREPNWVEQEGGLPERIKHLAEKLKRGGMTEGHAIATAVNQARKFCAQGDEPEWCAAAAQWEKMKAARHATMDAASDLSAEITGLMDRNVEEALRSLDALRHDAVAMADRDYYGDDPGERDRRGRFKDRGGGDLAPGDRVRSALQPDSPGGKISGEAVDGALRVEWDDGTNSIHPPGELTREAEPRTINKRADAIRVGDVLAGRFGAQDRRVTKVADLRDGSVALETQPGRGKPILRPDQRVTVRATTAPELIARVHELEDALRTVTDAYEGLANAAGVDEEPEFGNGVRKVIAQARATAEHRVREPAPDAPAARAGGSITIRRHGKDYSARIVRETPTRLLVEYTTQNGKTKQVWEPKPRGG